LVDRAGVGRVEARILIRIEDPVDDGQHLVKGAGDLGEVRLRQRPLAAADGDGGVVESVLDVLEVVGEVIDPIGDG
jgi:hypothetical protein